ncbi:hypothetical protein D6745_03090 [Candidatus Woesearchaeota archaeon]|nr:MAG: hypothetical protein D6745_03090 [Candidatus Woesearchaeota archaeon]
MRIRKATFVAIILGLLVIISVVQAFQLNSLKEKVAEGEMKISSASSTTSAAAGSSGRQTASLPSSIKDLPQMVGGC